MSDKRLVYVDVETTGLDPDKHHIWEVAYAFDSGDVHSGFVGHSTVGADEMALTIGQYSRCGEPDSFVEHEMFQALTGNILVGANPAFDAAFLRCRWGSAPWHYRMIDVESYAMPIMGWGYPRGLKDIAAALRENGALIPEPDHTAGMDVEVLRACFKALRHRAERRVKS